MNLQEFLGRRGVEFELVEHTPAYDAQHLADAIYVSGYHIAKTVLLRVDDHDYVIAVLPATDHVVMDKARKVLSASKVELATEDEVAQRCPDCEVGAMPPFGSHYGMQTLVDKSVMGDEQIVFERNTHKQAVRMKYDDFGRLEGPLVGPFSRLTPALAPMERNP